MAVHQFAAYTIAGLTAGSIYVMAAVGFTLVYRVVRVLDLTYSAVIVAGTFVAWAVQSSLSRALSPAATAPVAVLATLVACVVIELVLERLVIRRLVSRGASILVVIVATLGAFYVLQEILDHWQGPLPVSVQLPFTPASLAFVGGGHITTSTVVVVGGAALTMTAVILWSRLTESGRCVEAVAQDREAAVLMGIDLARIQQICFAVVGLTAGVAAVLYDVNYTSTEYEVALPLGILGLSAAVVGGMGNLYGAIAGGLILGLVESYGTAVLGASWQDTIAFVVLALLVLARPQGIISERSVVVRA